MTMDETRKLLTMIACNYSNFRLPDKDVALQIWTEVLEEYPVAAVLSALKIYIKTNTSGFAPSAGQLIEIMHSSSRGDLGPMAAWSLVSKAIRNGIYGYKAEFEKLPHAVQKTLGSAEQLRAYASDENYNEAVVSSHFQNAYKIVVKRQQDDTKVLSEIEKLGELMGIDRLLIGGSNG